MELSRTLRVAAAAAVLYPATAEAAPALDGAQIGWGWALPFIGILLSIATGPLLFRRIWHEHYGKIAAGWALAALLPLAFAFGAQAAFGAFVHIALADYLSFIVLLFALYTVAGGLHIAGNLGGRPWSNTAVLAFGTAIASVVGTTGASMILVRPLIRANAARRFNAHVIVFFIFLVGNIGGALSPLGDPPLLVGFLRGVDFLWPAMNLWQPTLCAAVILLGIFLAVDVWFARRDAQSPIKDAPVRIKGTINLLLLAAILAAIVMSSVWQPGITFDVQGTVLQLENLTRDAALFVIALLSVWFTPAEHRAANDFTWEPIREVAKLFAAIFVCIIPVLAMLQAGHAGRFAPLLAMVTAHDGTQHAEAYFWLTGILSAFLDNAPTYLIFFQLAGGNAAELMTRLAPTLAAISMGAVYLGALTYVGNAPNLMVEAIASERGVRMPSFFGYMLWASVVLLPVFAFVRWVLPS
jgi:Na+/H+ antiporter NhaD/arsenite permease-like protein